MRILPYEAITPALLTAYSQSERDKHKDCLPGGCRHAKESKEICKWIFTAFEGSEDARKRIDRQIEVTLKHAAESGNLVNDLRTLMVAMIAQGWELAAFAMNDGDELVS